MKMTNLDTNTDKSYFVNKDKNRSDSTKKKQLPATCSISNKNRQFVLKP
jgi:hypothetical protein